MVVGVRHVVVGTLGVAAVVKGGIWLLDSTIWLQQPERRKKGEKGEQSNREYSSKVLASKDLHYICNIIKGRLYMWTGLQKCQNRGENLVLSKTSIFWKPPSCSNRRE